MTRSCFYVWPFAIKPVHYSVFKVLNKEYHIDKKDARCQHDGMEKKKRKATMVRLSEDDLRAILVIRMQTGITSDNQAIVYAIHRTAKHLEQQGEPRAKAEDAYPLGLQAPDLPAGQRPHRVKT